MDDHVVNGNQQLTLLVEDGQVGGGVIVAADHDVAHVDAALGRLVQDAPARAVVAYRGEEHHGLAQAHQVLGNVTRHATNADPDRARRRRPGPDGLAGPALGVDAGGTDDEDVVRGQDRVSF